MRKGKGKSKGAKGSPPRSKMKAVQLPRRKGVGKKAKQSKREDERRRAAKAAEEEAEEERRRAEERKRATRKRKAMGSNRSSKGKSRTVT